MIKPIAIDHIVLRTVLYQELINFYCDVLGCAVERKLPDDIGLTQLRAGASLIDIVDSLYLKDIAGNNIELRATI